MVGEGAKLLVERALTAAGLAPDVDTALPRFLDLYDERLLAHTDVYPGTREMLDAVARDARLALLTNKPQHHTERILEGLSVRPRLGAVLGGGSRLGRKADPSGLRHLMHQAQVRETDTVLVGDSAIDLRTARAAGIRLCLVRFGFGFTYAEPELTGAELIADAPRDIPRLLQLAH